MPCPPPTPPCHLPIRSQRNKDRLIKSRMDVNVAKSSQTPTKVNAVPRSEKRKGEKRKRDGRGRGGRRFGAPNASLMRLLVVSAVGAWHGLGAVSQPTKICSACRISAALFCLRPTHTDTHIDKKATHSHHVHTRCCKSATFFFTNAKIQDRKLKKLKSNRIPQITVRDSDCFLYG